MSVSLFILLLEDFGGCLEGFGAQAVAEDPQKKLGGGPRKRQGVTEVVGRA